MEVLNKLIKSNTTPWFLLVTAMVYMCYQNYQIDQFITRIEIVERLCIEKSVSVWASQFNE